MFTIPLDSIFIGFMVFIRLGAFLLSIPVFSGQGVPVMVRGALALLTAILVVPIIPPAANLPVSSASIILVAFFELFVGLLMGMAMRIVIATIEFAGETIGREIGFVQQAGLNPLTSETGGGAIGTLLFYFGLLIFLAAGLHHAVIHALIRSFTLMPVGAPITAEFAFLSLVKGTGQLFHVGLLMAAPFVAINFLISVTFALLGKVAPKMNVFMVSFAVRILGGLAVLVATALLLAHYMFREYSQVPADMLNFLIP